MPAPWHPRHRPGKIADMDPERAMTIARCLHAGHREEGGTPVLRHIGRVARATHPDAPTVAWLHEARDSGVVTEHQLLAKGLGRHRGSSCRRP